jgi:antitoxin component HigA of HigAB toxin-antitoxin module
MSDDYKEDLMEIKEMLDRLNDKKIVVAEAIGITNVYLSYILNGKRHLTQNIKNRLYVYLHFRMSAKEQLDNTLRYTRKTINEIN